MSYEFDIFISYKRHPKTDDWYIGLKEWLEPWLSQELQRDARIFLDQEDIRTGERWRAKLSDSLQKSRCMVCLWSPLYFQSKWCVAEWQTFRLRGTEFGSDLIIPARFHDGEFYPPSAKEVEARDFSKFTSVSPRFWHSDLALEFEQKHLREFAEEIRFAIEAAPEFDEAFPIIEDPDDGLMIQRPRIGRPGDD